MAHTFAALLMAGFGSVAAIGSAQQTSSSAAKLLAAHPYCRAKASTPETLDPDPRFDVAPGTKPADIAPVLSRSKPVTYPTTAMESGICGTVVLQVHIKTDGKVGGARVVESLDKVNGLDADALKTISGWQFKPGQVNGKAVATVITVRVEYVLDALNIDPFEAADKIGRFAKVCGFLRPEAPGKAAAGMRHFEFALNKKTPVVRVPESAKDVLAAASVSDAPVCAIGPVLKADGRPQITVASTDRITKEVADLDLTGVAKRGDPGVTMPKILKQFDPKYTPQAMNKKVEGLVEMEAVVLTDGTVGAITVKKSLDAVYGLDREAVLTLRRWRFEPGHKYGRPVPVAIVVQMEFRLH